MYAFQAAYEGWYCVDCEEYKDEKELLMDESSTDPATSHKCPTHRKPCQHRSEENYFFALSKYQTQLQELIEGTDFVQVGEGGGVWHTLSPALLLCHQAHRCTHRCINAVYVGGQGVCMLAG